MTADTVGDNIPKQLLDEIDDLKERIFKLYASDKLDVVEIKQIRKQFAKVENVNRTDEKFFQLDERIRFLTQRTLAQKQQEKERASSIVLGWFSGIVWTLLIFANFLSIWLSPISGESGEFIYEWPRGWFNNFYFIGFAITGVAINIGLRQLPRLERGDWDSKFVGLWVFRCLQATVYSAVIYHLVNSLSSEQQNMLPFAVTGIFVGLFVDLLEKTFVGVGERFAEMIAALLVGKIESPAKKAEEIEKLDEQYTEMHQAWLALDKGTVPSEKRELIGEEFDKLFLYIQSKENVKAQNTLDRLARHIDDVKYPSPSASVIETSNKGSEHRAKPTTSQADGSMPSGSGNSKKNEQEIRNDVSA